MNQQLFVHPFTWQGVIGAIALLVVVLTVLALIREIFYGGRKPWE